MALFTLTSSLSSGRHVDLAPTIDNNNHILDLLWTNKGTRFNNNGDSADRGLFQLNDSYRKDWTINDFYNIDKNAHVGTRFLKEMITLNEDDILFALFCYNAGPTKVRRDGIIPLSTISYAKEIIHYKGVLDRNLDDFINSSHAS